MRTGRFLAFLFSATSQSLALSLPLAFHSKSSVPRMTIKIPKVIGHRGAKSIAPENTLASIRAAKRVGATFVEVDVMLSKDKVPIIHHDNTVDRCTNGKGSFSDFTAQELLALDAGSWFAPEFAGERLPLLTDLLSLCRELELGLNLEIKHAPDRADMAPTEEELALERELAEISCRAIQSFGPAPDTLVISSFSIAALEVCQKLLPDIPRSYLVTSIPDDWEATIQRLGCISLNFSQNRCTREQAEAISRRIPMFSYTVNDPARAQELLSWGVSGVFSDCPHTILAALAAAAP